jgi:hypothetical protein
MTRRIAPEGVERPAAELLTEQSNCAEAAIADYDERRGSLVEYWKSQNGRPSGDPAKLARALITIASQ